MFGVTNDLKDADEVGWGAPHLQANAAFDVAKKAKGGGFQSMGLGKELLKGIMQMGFNVPTPIQRKAIPPMMQGTDMVAMARTGSGKTAAFVIPLLHQLEEHSKLVGARGLIFSPTRELALQILHHVKQLSRFMNLTHCAIVGGKGLDAQFTSLAMNPDIIVATPGRLLHIVEESGMKLTRVSCVILDEADRLFELGLQPQIVTLLQRIHDGAQRALFSATMPSVLAEFTNAGLRNPAVIRLDAEMKLSDKLQQSSFIVRSDEKVAALILILRNIIGVRRKTMKDSYDMKIDQEKKRQERYRRRFQKKHDQRKAQRKARETQQQEGDEELESAGDVGVQALVFVESKHHVDFLSLVLALYEIPSSAVHGHLDQEARRMAVDDFAHRRTAVMIVTDVAARGIDLPLLDNVINFSFPATPKLFVHRVGRVARAGRSGSAYSLLTMEDLPSYIDLMSFLDLKAKCSLPSQGGAGDDAGAFAEMLENPYDGYFGRLPEASLQAEFSVVNRATEDDIELSKAKEIVDRAHKKFLKTKKKASAEGMQGAKSYSYETIPLHPVLLSKQSKEEAAADAAKNALRAFKAKESYLDIVHGEKTFYLKKARTLADERSSATAAKPSAKNQPPAVLTQPVKKMSLAEKMSLRAAERKRGRDDDEDEDAGAGVSSFLGVPADYERGDAAEAFKDPSFFLSEKAEIRQENAQYSIRDATLDIVAESAEDANKARQVFAWNKKKNRFQKMNVNDAKALVKGIKNEAGSKIDFKKGKLELYHKWTKTSNMRIQDVGEEEDLAAVERAKAENAKHVTEEPEEEEEDAGEAATLLNNPNKGKKLKIGRKLKRLPGKEGKVPNFTELLNKKQKKAKQQAKLERRREKKRGHGGGKK